MNQAKLVSCILYLKDQKRFYLDQHQDFYVLVEWLVGEKELEQAECEVLDSYGPDVCGECLHPFDPTISGRLREGCCFCKFSEERPLLHYYWPMKMAEILNTSYNVLETYMAFAVEGIRRARNAQ